jgi:hypothetical protein
MWIFGDSFDLYNVASDMNYYWDNTNVNNSFPIGRFPGGQAYSTSYEQYISKSSGQNHSIHKFNLAFLCPSGPFTPSSGNGASIYIRDAGVTQCAICFDNNVNINIYSGDAGGTLLGQYANAHPYFDQWFVYEIEVVIGPTGSVTIRRNNSSLNDYQLTGVNTQGGTANAYANQITIAQPQSVFYSHCVDDFLWRSDNASLPWLGDVRTYIRFPNIDINKQFTPTPTVANNYLNISEIHEDKLTTYISDTVVGHGDMYGISIIPLVPVSIVAITSRMYCQKSDAGSRQGVIRVKSGGITVQHSNPILLHTVWGWMWRMDITDPNTGAAWTNAAVDSLQVGPLITA